MAYSSIHMSKNRCEAGVLNSKTFHFAPQPNWGFNADADIGHGFAIFMAYVGTLRTSCSGAG